MKNTRLTQIIKILLDNQTEYLSAQKIAKMLDVSTKTIRYDLLKCEEILREYTMKIDLKQGSGVRIYGDDANRLMFSAHLDNISDEDFFKTREETIIIQLLFDGEISLKEIQDVFYISRSSANNEINAIATRLNRYKIKVIRKKNNPVRLEGKERYFRAALLDCMMNSKDYSLFVKMIQGEKIEKKNRLWGYFSYKELIAFSECIVLARDEVFYNMSFNSFANLSLMLFIVYVRIKSSHNVFLSDDFKAYMDTQIYYDESDYICNYMELHLPVKLSHTERKYIQIYCITLIRDFVANFNEHSEEDLAEKLIEKWASLGILSSFVLDEIRQKLKEYFLSSFMRMKHGIEVKGKHTSKIMEKFKSEASIVKNSVEFIEYEYEIVFNDDEIALLTLIFVYGLKKRTRVIKCLFVCFEDYIVRDLLALDLINNFPNLNIVEINNNQELEYVALDEYDLIITNRVLDIQSEKVIVVNSILEDYDISNLRKLIDRITNEFTAL